MTKRGGLGRGLAALIPTSAPAPTATPAARAAESAGAAAVEQTGAAPAPERSASVHELPARVVEEVAGVPGAQLREVRVGDVVPNPKQPRQVFDDEALDELTHSVREFGLLQPIVVREAGDGQYELIMGERRLRAARGAGLETVPAIVRDTTDDAMLRDALLENIHRANLNPLEEAAAYQQLLEEFGATHEELARRIGRSRPQISNTIRLLNLPAAVQRRVAAGILMAGHARALLTITDAEEQEQLARRIVAEGLSVRATEELAKLARDDAENGQKPTPPPRRAKPHAPALTDLADKLSDRFDTRVKVDIGRRKGKITIEFATVDDLERIVGIIGTEERSG